MKSTHAEQFHFCVSGESLVSPHRLRASLGWWCQHCLPHSPLGAVIVLHDDASELDKAISIFHFAAFYFSVFPVWCFPLVEVYAVLKAFGCGKILQA